MRNLLICLLAVFALSACSSGGSETASQAADTAADHAAATATTDVGTQVASVKTGDIEIVGKLGCGHCDHAIGETCSAAVQTADGSVYILEGLGAGDELFESRYGGKEVTVRGVSVERDGVGYVTVATFDL